MKILLIEDNEQDQKIIRKVLSRSGFEDVSIADNGEAGVEVAISEKPQIIIVDTVLPGIDGFETCFRIKKIDGLKGYCIMMTGRIDTVDANKARQMGADDYCVKTSDYKALLDAVKKYGADLKQADSPTPTKEVAAMDEYWDIRKTNENIRILYKELENKTEKLKELDKLKSEFVATTSHELRTPLTLIQGSISQILDGIYGDISELQREKLGKALNGAKLLRRIIDDLLDLSRLEAKAIKLNKESMDIVAVANEVRDIFLPAVEKKGLKFEIHSKHSEVNLVADRDRIVQVLTNLVGNAVKFTQKGSLDIYIEENKNDVICRVKDTGCGIDSEDQLQVFERFTQFGKKFNPGQEGTGLGLSICKSILELHGGTIFLESQKAKGSVFSFILPKHE